MRAEPLLLSVLPHDRGMVRGGLRWPCVMSCVHAAQGRRSGDWLSRERAGFTSQPHTRSYVIQGAYLNGSMIDCGGGVALIAANLSTPPRGAVTA